MFSDGYRVHDWFWTVGGNNSRAWSSAASSYVNEWPADRVTRIKSETELIDLLTAAGLPSPSVDATRNIYRTRVDADAEAYRLRYITPGAAMILTYQEKFAQAQAVASMGEAAANAMTQAEREAQFPTLAASVGIEAPTLWACSQIVLERYAQFAALSLVIERARLAGKAAVDAATTAAEARAAYEAVTWTP